MKRVYLKGTNIIITMITPPVACNFLWLEKGEGAGNVCNFFWFSIRPNSYMLFVNGSLCV